MSLAKDNEKGFFERIDVVLQNDIFFSTLQLSYSKLVNAKKLFTNELPLYINLPFYSKT